MGSQLVARSGKCWTTNNERATGAATAAHVTRPVRTRPHLNPRTLSVLNLPTYSCMRIFIHLSDSCAHMHAHTQAFAQQWGQARLLWMKILGGIINHKRLPPVESGLSWCEQSAMPAEQRRALAGWRAWGACRGFSLHPEAYQSSGWTMIRTRLWLRKAKWDTASTGDGFLCSSVHPAAKWETAGEMGSALFKLASFLRKLHLWRKLAFCLSIEDGWVMALDDKSDLGQLLKFRKMFLFKVRSQKLVTGPWNAVIKYYQVQLM